MIQVIGRDIKLALQNFYRNLWLSIATMIIIVLTLLSVNILVSLQAVSLEAVTYLKNKVDVTVYLKPEATGEQVDNMKTFLATQTGVKSVEVIPKEDALTEFAERFKNDPIVQESLLELQGNPLGDSLVIKAVSLEGYDAILKLLDQDPYRLIIEQRDFRNYTLIIDNLRSVIEKIQKMAYIITTVLMLIAVLVLFNTIRMTIYTRRREIGIMKLVGATNWFVASPFFIESFLYAFVAFVVAVILLMPLLRLMQPYITELFPGSSFSLLTYYQDMWWPIFRWQFLGVVVLSVISSAVAIQRYLRV
ncbi:MAG: permease-like cell division protein FtsX [bacterium]|nr:permease-like cell division protein FtsX [bacterium]